MDSNVKSKWIAALRSGDYKQGFNNLYNRYTDSYCCLGVLCKITDSPRNLENRGIPFASEYEYLDLDEHTVSHLANMNDSGKSFYEIADYIEANL